LDASAHGIDVAEEMPVAGCGPVALRSQFRSALKIEHPHLTNFEAADAEQ
jgi:hypothetical protein